MGDQVDTGAGTAGASNPGTQPQPAFVNTGYNTWLERRQQWLSKKSDATAARPRRRHLSGLTYDQVLNERPFPKPVALEEVVQCLVDIWEQEEGWD